MLGTEEMSASDGGNDNVRFPRDGGQILCARVGDGDGRVPARALPHEEQGERFSDDHAAPDDHGFAPGRFYAVFREQPDAAHRCAGHEPGGVIHGELADIYRVESVHILAGIDRADDFRLVDVSGGRGLDEDAVDSRVVV